MKFVPIKDKVHIRLDPQKERKGERIFIPQTAATEPSRPATVVACGSECKLLKPGDRVFIEQFTGRIFALLGPDGHITEEWMTDLNRICFETEILGFLEEE